MKNKTIALLSIAVTALLAGCSPQDGNKTVADLEKENAELKKIAALKEENEQLKARVLQDDNHANVGLEKEKAELKEPISQPKTESDETIDYDQLVERNGMLYEINSGLPFTGTTVIWHPLGENGVSGRRTADSKKAFEVNYRNGKVHGTWTRWHENGQKCYEHTYNNGRRADGKTIYWHDNGQKLREETIKDGKAIGTLTIWYANGQKSSEHTYKDGKQDGIWTEWYEDGTKSLERTYRDGKEIKWESFDRK